MRANPERPGPRRPHSGCIFFDCDAGLGDQRGEMQRRRDALLATQG